MFLLAVTLAVAGMVAWAAVRCAVDVGRRVPSSAGRRGWWAALALGVVLIPLQPGPTVPVRTDRMLYEGPDILSSDPQVTGAVAERWTLPGLVRIRTLRTTQGDLLLRETRRVEVAIPLLLLLVLSAWGVARGRREPREGGAGRAAVVVALVAGSAAGCARGEMPEPSLAEVRLMEVMAMRHSGDVTGAEDIFHPAAVYDDYPNQLQHRGLPEIADFIQGLHRWASGVFLDVVRVHAAGDRAVAEWVLDGVQSAPYPGVADSATFRRFRLEGVTVVEVERGLVVRVADYADMVPLILELGGSVTLPSGEVVVLPDGGEG
ncbi:MAG TPA: nuclear transport factor 2 family protein [Longimicrobiales bacterium]|nr:nuclear transport factor 2 family protein [Longimicrobiales bacterium]